MWPFKSRQSFDVKKTLLAVVILLVVAGASFFWGVYWTEGSVAQFGTNVSGIFDQTAVGQYRSALTKPQPEFDQALFWQVWNTIEAKYVDHANLDKKKLFYGALKGVAEASGDPYTVFFDPEETKSFHNDVSGQFEGIGAEIGMKDNLVTIVSPLEGMPAEKAGLRAGDQILEIDGTSTLNMDVNRAVKLIRGPRGTQVTLTIGRASLKKSFKVSIARAVIKVKSVKTEFKNGIAIVKVNNFNETTESEFNEAIAKILTQAPSGLILDLRNNPGGLLNTAIAMCGRWIGRDVAVIEKFAQGRERKHKSASAPSLKDIKTVVLVNGGSASAAEIVAGALQDYKLAILVGQKTFGKGSVQTMEDLADGSSLKVTTALWLTPKGRSINKEGIKPDIEIELSEADDKADKDPQLDKAMEVIRNYSKYLK